MQGYKACQRSILTQLNATFTSGLTDEFANKKGANMSGERDKTIDSIKFILIGLVVLAHFLELDVVDKDNLVGYNFIYLFHMPLFVMVSGMCFKMKSKEKLLKSCAMLLETYIVCQCYMLLFDAVIEGTPTTLKSLLVPQYHLWYIIALLAWKLVLTGVIRVFKITPPYQLVDVCLSQS